MSTHISGKCSVALKEWAVTCRALAEGRQIVLLRKGGILDEDGVFALEHPHFWLTPTYLHQDKTLVKPQHHDLFQNLDEQKRESESQAGRDALRLQFWARAENVWALQDFEIEKLYDAPHIWSRNYLDTRFNYKPDHPLLCVALHVYRLPSPVFRALQPEWGGCRSWLELGEEIFSLSDAQPVLNDEEFAAQVEAVERYMR
jgi:hypothetical protein